MPTITEKITFKVFNKQGEDITNQKDWVIRADGTLCFATDNLYYPLRKADDCYYTITNCKQELNW